MSGDKPKAPPTAYFLFQEKARAEVVAKRPELKGKVAEQAKVFGEMWRNLGAEEKKKYEDKAKAAKEEYEAKHGKVERGSKAKTGGAKAGKDKGEKKPRGLSAYMFFSQAERQNVIKEQPELASKVAEVAKVLGAKWKALSDAEKKPYEKMAEEDKAKKAQ